MGAAQLTFLPVDSFQAGVDDRVKIAERFREAYLSGRMYSCGFKLGQKIKIVTDIHNLKDKILEISFLCENLVVLFEGSYEYCVRASDCRALCQDCKSPESAFSQSEAIGHLLEGHCLSSIATAEI